MIFLLKTINYLTKQLVIDDFIEDYIVNVVEPKRISMLDLPLSVKERFDLSRTILIDVTNDKLSNETNLISIRLMKR